MSIPTGFYPFWFWNDELDKEEIKWQIKEMAARGIKGFYIHSRQGLKQPYMSESFLEMVDLAVEEAEKQGLVANLYDEYPYPSGIAGGEVVLGKPEYYATELINDQQLVDGGQLRIEYPAGAVISAKAYPYQEGKINWKQEIDLKKYIGLVLVEDSYIETGLTNYNQKRYFGSDPRPVLDLKLPDGKYKIFVSIQREVKKYKYWDKYIDVLNEDVIDRFLELTHEKYAERYNSKFGEKVYSIFTDEIHPTWSDKIPTEFEQEYGYNLEDYLPALMDETHPEHSNVVFDLHQLKYKLFCQSYEKKISSWCQENNILYAGEKPSLRLEQLQYMDIPGCDAGHKKAGSEQPAFAGDIRANARATASAAYFYDKEHALCECYHSLGWSGTLQDAKFNAEELLALGIDLLVPHGFFYSTHGLKKHDAPPSFFFQMPFWPLFDKFSARIDAVQQEIEGGYLDADLLVVDPGSGAPTEVNLKEYEKLLSFLLAEHIDYLITDTNILQSAKIKEGLLQIKDITVDRIVVPPMRKIESELKACLDKFKKAGIKVIYQQNKLADVSSEITEGLTVQLSLQAENQEIEELLVSRRIIGGKKVWFVVNSSEKKFRAEIRTAAGHGLREAKMDKNYTLLQQKNEDLYEREIFPFESFVLKEVSLKDEPGELRTENQQNIMAAAEDQKKIEVKVQVDKVDKIKVQNKNLLRMHNWQLSLQNEKNNCLQTAEVEAVPLSNQLNKSALAFSPDFREYFGHRPEIDFPELQLNYQYQFKNNYQGRVELLMEPETIKGDYLININGKGEIKEEDFSPTQAHVRGSKSIDISDYLKKGDNLVEIKLKAAQPSQGLINPLYLAGDFGVDLAADRLTEQPETGLFEDYLSNKLPYYAGVIEYQNEFSLEEVPAAGSVLLKIDYQDYFHEAAEVAINDSDYYDLLWEPRCIIVDSSELKKGKNIIKTKVYTTLIRSFEGKEFDYEDHKYKSLKNLLS
ncbi:MAG: glycosyl hydrolase [Halanaerobiales bacterium]|nr:glycosyl hydrolase [Halanaerobiales bacterium]